jgi:hypothetical protein
MAPEGQTLEEKEKIMYHSWVFISRTNITGTSIQEQNWVAGHS